jgi:hypothetical protein
MSVTIPFVPTGSTLIAAMSCAMTFPRPVYSGIHTCPIVQGEEPTEDDGDLTECYIVPRNRSLPIRNQLRFNQVIRSRARPFPQNGEVPTRNFRLARNANQRARRNHSIHQPGRTNCTQRYQLKM